MIRFFRSIRQSLLAQGGITRYLIYALGEIVLVVIGILIALQINNWNERKKIQRSIGDHLSILQDNLAEDRQQLLDLQGSMADNVNYADSLLGQIRGTLPIGPGTKKFLAKLLLEKQFRPNRNAIETMTASNELPYLRPDLRTAVLDYYALISSTSERESISNTQIQTKYEHHINGVYPEVCQRDNEWEFMRELYKDDPRLIVPMSAQKLQADHLLESHLVSRYYQSLQLERFYSQLLVLERQLSTLLKEYP